MPSGTWGPGGDGEEPMRVVIRFTMGTTQAQTGFKMRAMGVTLDDPAGVLAAILPWVENSFAPLLLTTDTVPGVDVVNITSGESASHSFANLTGGQAVGGVAGNTSLPGYVMANVSLKGTIRRRYGQGGMRWPVRIEQWVDGDQLNAAGAAAFQGAIDALVEDFVGSTIEAAGYRIINAHGPIAAKPATPTTPARDPVPASWYDVSTIRLNRNLSFLRSRKAGVGS